MYIAFGEIIARSFVKVTKWFKLSATFVDMRTYSQIIG